RAEPTVRPGPGATAHSRSAPTRAGPAAARTAAFGAHRSSEEEGEVGAARPNVGRTVFALLTRVSSGPAAGSSAGGSAGRSSRAPEAEPAPDRGRRAAAGVRAESAVLEPRALVGKRVLADEPAPALVAHERAHQG